jgi:hypothetical protein
VQSQQYQKISTDNGDAGRRAAEDATREREAAATQKAIQDAAAQHAAFLTRYLNQGFTRKPGVEMVAIVVAGENGNVNRAVGAALTDHLKTQNAEILSSFFTPEFISDGLLNTVIGGSTELPRKLELGSTLDVLVLARQQVQYSTNPDLLNVMTASMQLEVVLVPVSGNAQGESWSFTASGTGFNQATARQLAEERLIKQIANDTKMSLN